jgi:hypothetical protein
MLFTILLVNLFHMTLQFAGLHMAPFLAPKLNESEETPADETAIEVWTMENKLTNVSRSFASV